MRKISLQIVAILVFCVSLGSVAPKAWAAGLCQLSASSPVTLHSNTTFTVQIPDSEKSIPICPDSGSFKNCLLMSACIDPTRQTFGNGRCGSNSTFRAIPQFVDSQTGVVTATFPIDGNLQVWIDVWDQNGTKDRICSTLGDSSTEWTVNYDKTTSAPTCGNVQAFTISDGNGKSPAAGQTFQFDFNLTQSKNFADVTPNGVPVGYGVGIYSANGQPVDSAYSDLDIVNNSSLTLSGRTQGSSSGLGRSSLQLGNYTIGIYQRKMDGSGQRIGGVNDLMCATTFCVGSKVGDCSTAIDGQGASFNLCKQAAPSDYQTCNDCLTIHHGLWTGIGCIPVLKTDASGAITGVDTPTLIGSLIKVGLGLSGGVVLLSILAGAFMLATSAGNTKRVEEAQQIISASVIGLLFVVFSILILQFVAVSILHIPGFGG